LAILTDKSPTTFFTLSPKQTLKPQIQKAETKAKHKLAIVWKQARISCGEKEKILKRVYEGII